jgi:predicted acylesterase/phospholipase RssA
MHNLPNSPDDNFRILSLDGGGAKGAFTLGVLSELEKQINTSLCDHFNLIYGTSTGAIIAAYLALGFNVQDVYKRYLEIIPRVMSKSSASGRSSALEIAANREFGKHTFSDVRCMLAIVATRCDFHRPIIFKSHATLGHAKNNEFVPGFGLPLVDCLLASSAAAPFFLKKNLTLNTSPPVSTDCIDGGFVANNPSLFSLFDATQSLRQDRDKIRLFSVGTGIFPQKQRWTRHIKKIWLLSDAIYLLEETLESNANSAEFIRSTLYSDIKTTRINPIFKDIGFSTDLLESNRHILEKMYQCGVQSYIDYQKLHSWGAPNSYFS